MSHLAGIVIFGAPLRARALRGSKSCPQPSGYPQGRRFTFAGHAWLSDLPSVPLRQRLRGLQGAFAIFWVKRTRNPRFESKHTSRTCAEHTTSAFSIRNGEPASAKMNEALALVWSRPLLVGAQPSTAIVFRDAAGRWFVSMPCDDCPSSPAPVNTAVGIDAGIDSLATLSAGERITETVTGSANRAGTRSSCETTPDRDINAAGNVRAAGPATTACGNGVRPQRSTPGGQSVLKEEASRPPHT